MDRRRIYGVRPSSTDQENIMKDFRYLSGVTTLAYAEARCVGCTSCVTVCPHGVFVMDGKKARLADKDGCMECGACALNCPSGAILVTPGVGCAAYIISGWIHGKEKASCCGQDGCC
jgi:NAD-dependent dihydropyrimidine dehydrogenase PreA subunit